MAFPYNSLTVAAALGAILLNGAPVAAHGQASQTSCSVSSAPATIRDVVSADAPLIAQILGETGVAMVQVSLSNSGALESATIAKSSGSKWLDAAALTTAREQRYSPEISDCQAVGGTYLVSVDFTDVNLDS
jgi:TonB family protein